MVFSVGEDRLKKSIAVGIPCYGDVSLEVFTDYARMMFSFGRRYTEYNFYLITKGKSEQFRARNAIVETALAFGADYLLFLDDDQIIDWEDQPDHDPYGFLQELLDEDKDIIGGLYYHRGGDFMPVIMKKADAGYAFYDDNFIDGTVKEVDVQGGGCMLINMKIFDKILPPYFEPEQSSGDGPNFGTDIQLCLKAQNEGFKVYCHTGVVIGHLKKDLEIISPRNRDLFLADSSDKHHHRQSKIGEKWYNDYLNDAKEYTGMEETELYEEALLYHHTLDEPLREGEDLQTFLGKQPQEYMIDHYKSIGVPQLARQVNFHGNEWMRRQAQIIVTQLKGVDGQGLDFGCGSAPVGYQLLRRGSKIDFVDIDGTYAYDFLKWRIEKDGLGENAGWKLHGPYDWVMMLDVIEHLKDWEKILDNIISRMPYRGVFVTNFLRNSDYKNPEHIMMDKEGFKEFMYAREVYPMNDMVFVKHGNIGPTKAVE